MVAQNEEMTRLQEEIRNIAQPILQEAGLLIYGLTVQRNKRNVIARLTLDRVDGELTVGDCEAVSKKLSSALDVHELISGRYYLEVSSPGVERALRSIEECRRFVGRLAFFEFEDGRTVLGDIISVEGDRLTVAKKDGSQEVLVFGAWRKAHLKLDLEKALKKKVK